MVELHAEPQTLGIELWPRTPRIGERMTLAFRAARIVGATKVPRYDVTVLDARRRPVAVLLRGPARPVGGVVCADWDGTDDQGALVAPGMYRLLVRGVGFPLHLERTLHLDRVAEPVPDPAARRSAD